MIRFGSSKPPCRRRTFRLDSCLNRSPAGSVSPLEDTDGFVESLFPSGDHEAEPRIRIGPIKSERLATDAA